MPLTADTVESLTKCVYAYVRSRTSDPHLQDDVVQETMSKILAVSDRLIPESLTAYAIVCARNALAADYRRRSRDSKFAPRLAHPETLPDHNESDPLVIKEERDAIVAALDTLPVAEKDLLLNRHVTQQNLSQMAANQSKGSVALRLARARAKLRVEYLIAYRKLQLPTPRCKPALLAVSMGDHRRQEQLQAGKHFATCETCADLYEPLLQRKRGLALAVPLGLINIKEAISTHPAASSLGGAGVATAGVAAALVLQPASPAPDPCLNVVTVANHSLASVDLQDTAPASTVSVNNAMVGNTVTKEGFWATCGTSKLWVQMQTSTESAVEVLPGKTVSFDATLAAHQAGYAQSTGITQQPDASQLDAQLRHVEVPAANVRVGD